MFTAVELCVVLNLALAIISASWLLLSEDKAYLLTLPVYSPASLRFLPFMGLCLLPMGSAKWISGFVVSSSLFVLPYPTTILLLLLSVSFLVMSDALSPEHQALFSEIAPHIIDLMDTRLTGAIDERLSQVFNSRFDVQMAAWQANTLPTLLNTTMARHRPEPSVLNISFTGSHAHLLNFVHVVRDTLSRHSNSFPDEASRIKWIARHFVPVGSASHNWWMKLVRQNAAEQGVTDVFEAPGLPFVLPVFNTVDAFLRALVNKFKDKYAAENALKDLQALKQGDKKIGEFNSLFTSLSSLLIDLPESILINFYKNSLNVKILAQAIGRTDWASAMTLRARQDIAVLASDQLDEMKKRNANPLNIPVLPVAPSSGVSVPHDPNAMDLDVHALTVNSSFPHDKFKTACHKLRVCTRCLGPWVKGADNRHTCVYAPATLQAKIDFLKSSSSQKSRSSNLPTTVSYPPAGPPAPVVPVAAMSALTPAPLLHRNYHSPQHFYSSSHPPPFGYVYLSQQAPLPPAPPVFPPSSLPVTSPPSVSQPFSVPFQPPLPTSTTPTVGSGSPALPVMQTSGVSATFSEYANLSQPVYYDLPGATYDDPQISSVTFSNAQADTIRLVLSISLFSGLKMVRA